MTMKVTCPKCNGLGYLDGDAALNSYTGAKIAEYRNVRGMSQQDLSSKVGRSRAQVANIESGRTDLPLSLLLAFAQALHVGVTDLLPPQGTVGRRAFGRCSAPHHRIC